MGNHDTEAAQTPPQAAGRVLQAPAVPGKAHAGCTSSPKDPVHMQMCVGVRDLGGGGCSQSADRCLMRFQL